MLIDQHLKELEGKRIGLVMNPTARINGVHMLDTLISLNVNITALFAAEHGFRGDKGAGETITNGIDQESGLPVYSLYGNTKKPTSDMLANVDILLFDMQDVGARFFTYYSTLRYVMESVAGTEKEVWILDRPNPAGGNYVAGWVIEQQYMSFVGSYPIPIAHGMTLGELSKMAAGEGWLQTEEEPAIRVIEMEGWHREMKWKDTGLEWIAPSPNLPTPEHAYVYLGTCLFEGTSISEGRGTENPFLMIGAPDFKYPANDMRALSDKYNMEIEPTVFTPVSIPGKALQPKYEDQGLNGIRISVNNETSDPVGFGVELLHIMLNNSEHAVTNVFLLKLAGTEKVLKASVPEDWGDEFDSFLKNRTQYLLYD